MRVCVLGKGKEKGGIKKRNGNAQICASSSLLLLPLLSSHLLLIPILLPRSSFTQQQEDLDWHAKVQSAIQRLTNQ